MTKADKVYAKAGFVPSILVVFGCLVIATPTSGQPPELSKTQRTLLQAVVQAVDAAVGQSPTPDAAWPVHVLRASDGSHYVAFSVEPTGEMKLPPGPVLLYVRLATATGGTVTTLTEQSAIRDWLVGKRVDPRLLPGRGIALGEMPAFGAGAIGIRGSTPSPGSMDLKLMAMERERIRQEKEDRDKHRRTELEGRGTGVRQHLPFEDFDLASNSVAADGTRNISRAFTLGPGEYRLFVGWANPAAPKEATTIHVMNRHLSLPAATTTELTVSSVIIADAVTGRAAPYPPDQQAAHPYAIGATDITPARDGLFTSDEGIAVAFQVINAQPSDTGKPDVGVDFRIVRVHGEREVPVASLNPQSYTESSMPPDFDLRLGHPLFVAVSAPLATVPRGSYRLKITVNDRRAGVARLADAAFTVAGTPRSLLAEAPPLGRPFRREDAIEGAVLTALLQGLTPASASPALHRALALAAGGKFVDLLVEDAVPPAERAVRATLTGLALYALGDASALGQFQRAYALGGPGGPIQFLTGAVRATQDRDADAIAAWHSAKEEGLDVTAPFLVDAYLRRNEGERAAALVVAELARQPGEGSWERALAVTHLATGKEPDAVLVLERRLAQAPNDVDAQWLMLQALYGQIVRSDRGNRERFTSAAQAYITAGGVNAALATEWLQALGRTK